MTLAEHAKVVDFGCSYVAGRVPLIAGTGSNDTAAAIELTREAAKSGADAVLSVTPYYNKTSQRGLIAHFNAIADCSDCPIILYNVPSRTGISFTAETYQELSKHPNINGSKEASGISLCWQKPCTFAVMTCISGRAMMTKLFRS